MGSTTAKALSRYGSCVTRRSHSFTCRPPVTWRSGRNIRQTNFA